MFGTTDASTRGRPRLTRERVLRAAVALADDGGIDALSMRRLGHALGVEAMSLYNHVANKDDLLDGIVDLVWSEIELPSAEGGWRVAVRATAVSSHEVLLRHPWACGLVMSPARNCPARLRYMEAILRRLRDDGFSAGLTYHAYHALDSHAIGFTLWEVGHSMPTEDLESLASSFLPTIADDHPYLVEHAEQHLAGFGRDGDGEFEFVLDLILDGVERVRASEVGARG